LLRALAGIVILAIALVRRELRQLTGSDTWGFALLGVANNALYLGLGYTGLQSVSAGLGGLIVSANPVFTAALAALLLGPGARCLGCCSGSPASPSSSGIAWESGPTVFTAPCSRLRRSHRLLAAPSCSSCFRRKAASGSATASRNLAAGTVLAPIALIFADAHDITPNEKLLGAFLFLTLGRSIFAYLLWFHLLKVCGATAASAYHFLMPPLGMLFAWMVLGEHVAVCDLAGIVPVALGIYLVTGPGGVFVARSKS
jgi:drug/metabolite transporter (DMT)-like permease